MENQCWLVCCYVDCKERRVGVRIPNNLIVKEAQKYAHTFVQVLEPWVILCPALYIPYLTISMEQPMFVYLKSLAPNCQWL